MFRYLFLLLLIVALFFGFRPISYAQFDGLEENIISEIKPEYPRLNEQVVISIESYATDLNAAYIEWKVNDKSILKGNGKKSTSFILKEKTTKINISITTDDGRFVTKNFTITPTSLDILWEANTYTPPFFKGKALFTRQSSISFFANPHIPDGQTEIPKENMIYKWYNNGKVLDNVSGYGKYYMQINSGILGREMEIEVEATDPKSGQVAYGSLNLSPQEPVVYIYEKDPLLGVKMERALDESNITDKSEKELYVIPYFFSINNPNSLNFTWTINGKTIDDSQNLISRIFRKIENVYGVAEIGVNVESSSKIMQSSNSSIKIDFQKPKEENNSIL